MCLNTFLGYAPPKPCLSLCDPYQPEAPRCTCSLSSRRFTPARGGGSSCTILQYFLPVWVLAGQACVFHALECSQDAALARFKGALAPLLPPLLCCSPRSLLLLVRQFARYFASVATPRAARAGTDGLGALLNSLACGIYGWGIQALGRGVPPVPGGGTGTIGT